MFPGPPKDQAKALGPGKSIFLVVNKSSQLNTQIMINHCFPLAVYSYGFTHTRKCLGDLVRLLLATLSAVCRMRRLAH